MTISPKKLNLFLLFKLPSAYFTGVRATFIDDNSCEVKVKHKWINQNPFKSMFWAVQGMAAELTTGALMLTKIKASGKRISMLVANNKGSFTKKATGRITFKCHQGDAINEVIKKAIETGEGQTIWLYANGVDESGDEVSQFGFEWTLKVK
ncbi:DUF4442 domain-containing protein [Mangrovimonas spongiae]|uniref:DUF4442 domain-containing protein n=1 Tax=Mangrovimonas spongiae TaxID=2494697 RepID=A0A3R9N4Y4_9FLAO|nr:DUF4442 domain-containing protein [Mangrovimonas spongiae]RSK39124.1 DUF4442 domain-containing protein [Mangrovimonas spongiae]